jgi:hypothetical protein
VGALKSGEAWKNRGVCSPQTLSAERRIVAVAPDCAERVLGLFEAEAPGDIRPLDAIARTRAIGRGQLDIADEIRRRFVGGGAFERRRGRLLAHPDLAEPTIELATFRSPRVGGGAALGEPDGRRLRATTSTRRPTGYRDSRPPLEGRTAIGDRHRSSSFASGGPEPAPDLDHCLHGRDDGEHQGDDSGQDVTVDQ